MRIAFTLLISLLIVFSQSPVYGQRKFELGDLDNLYTLTDPQISPDGKSVLIVVSKPDTVSNKNKSFIYQVDASTGATRQLTFERTSVSFPRWSSSGNAIAFISTDAAGKGQIFVMSTAGGEAQKITSSPTGVQQFSWSPDERTFAFVQEDEVTNKKEIDKGYDAFEIKSNSMYLHVKPNPAHIWLISSSGGDAKRLTAGSWTVPSTASAANLTSPAISWSPDGNQIAFQCNETPYSDELVYTVKTMDIATGKINRVTTKQIDKGAMHRERQPVFSPDGKSIAYQFQLNNVGYGSDVYFTSINGGEGKNLTAALDRCFFRSEWSADSKALFVAANDLNTVSLWMQPFVQII